MEALLSCRDLVKRYGDVYKRQAFDRQGEHQIPLIAQQVLIEPLDHDDQRQREDGDGHQHIRCV